MLDRREFIKTASIASAAALASSEIASVLKMQASVAGREYHVSPQGNDQHEGSHSRSFATSPLPLTSRNREM